MNEELLQMSQTEIDRLQVMEKLSHKQLTQRAASRLLGISTRWVRQLQARYALRGAAGLISARRGQPSNRRLPDEERQHIATLIREHYHDFKPTLAHEKLVARHGVHCSRETVRQIMIEANLWQVKHKKATKRLHQQRTRRPCFGELVQIDGSSHDWFEGRAPCCCLIVFVDDATSKLLALRFVEVESTQAYFHTLAQHLKCFGRPLAYYSDKHSIFRINANEAKTGSGLSQFGRACQELGIELICANTPEAKGRVERANQTLQDRLVKEMRLAKLNNINAANAWLPSFIEDYNQRFGVEPHDKTDAHRHTLPRADQLTLILSKHSTRTVSKQLEISYHQTIFQLQLKTPTYAMRGAKVTVCDHQGDITLLYKGRILPYKTLTPRHRPTPIIDSKAINPTVALAQQHQSKPSKAHPWRKTYKHAC